jgi:hypothetical protein
MVPALVTRSAISEVAPRRDTCAATVSRAMHDGTSTSRLTRWKVLAAAAADWGLAGHRAASPSTRRESVARPLLSRGRLAKPRGRLLGRPAGGQSVGAAQTEGDADRELTPLRSLCALNSMRWMGAVIPPLDMAFATPVRTASRVPTRWEPRARGIALTVRCAGERPESTRRRRRFARLPREGPRSPRARESLLPVTPDAMRLKHGSSNTTIGSACWHVRL